jgi:hypothetical protein
MDKNKFLSYLYKFLVFTAIYILIIGRWGYELGRDDQIQALGYAEMISDSSLFTTDYYLQNIDKVKPNERYVFSYFLSFFTGNAPFYMLLLHYATSLLLFFGIFKIASIFIKNKVLIWLSILTLFIPLYLYYLGSCELYYPNFFVSIFVKTIAVWGIYLFLKKEYFYSYLVFIIATFFHQVVGLQLFIILTGVLLLGKIVYKLRIDWFKIGLFILIYIVTSGIWMIILKQKFDSGFAGDNQQFFDIIFKFRLPHHYLPSTFLAKYWLVEGSLIIVGLIYFYKKSKAIYLFFITVILGLIIYTIGVEGFNYINITAFQWFKTTMWLEMFSVIALFGFIEKHLPILQNAKFKITFNIGLFLSAIIVIIMILFFKENIPFKVRYDFGTQYQDDANVDIAVQIRILTEKDALFVHPQNYIELRYYAKRNSFVDYKIMPLRKHEIMIWWERLSYVYGYNYKDTKINKLDFANEYYKSLKEEDFEKLKKYGVQYILTFKDHNLNFPVLCQNDEYIVYSLI